jgi:hypothetical protein
MDFQAILDQITQSFGSYVPQIIGAVAILIIGWIIALIVAAIVRGALRRTGLGNRLADWVDGAGGIQGPEIARKIGKGVFWLIMILVFVAVFQALNLTIATEPLNNLLNQVFQFIPKLIGAAILLLVAWIIATIVRMIVSRALSAINLDDRISGNREGEEGEGSEEQRVSLTKIIADGLYWLIFLLFLPAVLGALGLQGLLTPVQELLNKFLGFLPNIIAAGLIAVIGWFVATIVRRLITNLLSAIGTDRLGERFGLPISLSGAIGIIVYVLILIPVIVAALNALALDAITQPVSNMLNLILSAMPNIFAAGVVLIVAYLLGRVVASLVTSLLTGVGFNSIMALLGLAKEQSEDEATEGKKTPAEVVGTLVLVAIMIFAIFEASSLLGFAVISSLIAKFTVFAGHIILGLIILAIGLYLANMVAKAVHASGTAQAGLLALVARVAILALVGAIALRQMGIANEIISLAFGLLLGSMAIAAAIAFGIGGRDIAARKLEEWSEAIKSEEE